MSGRQDRPDIVKASRFLPMKGIVHPRVRHPSLGPAMRPAALGALVVLLLAAGVVAKVAATRAEQARYDRAAATTMRAEAQGISRAAAGRTADGPAAHEISDLLDVVAGRSGTSRAILVDDTMRVVASGTPEVTVGSRVADPLVAGVLGHGGLAAAGGTRRARARVGSARRARPPTA
jgi:hypothetical protein